jgi:hypothetical protein
MSGKGIAPALRWLAVIAAIVWASAWASVQPPTPPHANPLTIDLMPQLFTTADAIGAPVTTGCKGTPSPPADSLQITLKSIQFKDANGNNAKEVLTGGAQTLDFAQNAGTVVGNFVSGAQLDPNVTYTKITLTVGSTLSVKCTVPCDPGAAAPRNGLHNWVTKNGNTQSTDTDDIDTNIAKGTSTVTLNNGTDSSFTKDLPSPISNGVQTVDLKFSNSSACELWDISNLTGHPAKTDFKVLPGAPSPKV